MIYEEKIFMPIINQDEEEVTEEEPETEVEEEEVE
jgi:hypothetical protein